MHTQKDTIRVQGPLSKTLSGKQHHNLQDMSKENTVAWGRAVMIHYRIQAKCSGAAVLIPARLRDNRAIQIFAVIGIVLIFSVTKHRYRIVT